MKTLLLRDLIIDRDRVIYLEAEVDSPDSCSLLVSPPVNKTHIGDLVNATPKSWPRAHHLCEAADGVRPFPENDDRCARTSPVRRD